MIDFGLETLAQVSRDVWESMLDISLKLKDANAGSTAPTSCSKTGAERLLSGCVQVTGAWCGAVRIDCSQAFAKRTAAAFLAADENSVSREQMLDALGEVTNMVTGSVKPLLPRPCHISLPSVVDGTDYELNIRKGRLLLTCEFENGGEPLKVTLFEADPSAGEQSRRESPVE